MIKIQGATCTYVQAWDCVGPGFAGLVYDQSIAIDKIALGCAVTITTIVRREGKDPEFLPGTIASEVAKHRESNDS